MSNETPSHTEILHQFNLQHHCIQYPIMLRITKDYLAQGSAVSTECAFFSSGIMVAPPTVTACYQRHSVPFNISKVLTTRVTSLLLLKQSWPSLILIPILSLSKVRWAEIFSE